VITSVEGTLAGAGPDWVGLVVGPVTLRVSVPHSAVEGLGRRGDLVTLFTDLQVKDDGITLFGFPTEAARSAFQALIGVGGVGPRGALSVLSSLTPDALALAVSAGDPDAFKGVHGVGTKTANRIVLELKGKLDWGRVPVAGTTDDGDLVDALTALGMSVPEAMAAASSMSPGNSMSLEEKVRLTLHGMASG